MGFMSGIGSALGAAGGSAAGSLLTYDLNRKEAHKQRSWQAGMSATSYQRAVKDLRKAGLNKALAYGQGGASTPGGATASAPPIEGAASAMEALKLKQELSNMKAEEQNINSSSDLNATAANRNRATTKRENYINSLLEMPAAGAKAIKSTVDYFKTQKPKHGRKYKGNTQKLNKLYHD
ncbi:DNA pilot protein [Microviridae sp.]|nr:DNA pilot protein [Microviridae sp.]